MIRKTAKEILAESFLELAEKKSIDRITIRDITDNCGYSPATFYRHFADKFDLIAWDYVNRTRSIMRRIGTEGYSWVQTLTDGALYFWENRAYLKNLLTHTNGHDSFVRRMASTNTALLTDEITKAAGGEPPDADTALSVRIYCYGTVQLVCDWILGEITASPEQISKVFRDTLPEQLRKYLQSAGDN